MNQFQTYTNRLADLAAKAAYAPALSTLSDDLQLALNGQACRELRRLVPIRLLRKSGAFFTSSTLADALAAELVKTVNAESRIIDPACGAGDLLLGCARALQHRENLAPVGQLWPEIFGGCDIHKEFVDAARARLMLQAAITAPSTISLTAAHFKNITHQCGLSSEKIYDSASHIIMNPPFNQVVAPEDCSWASGRINNAARFVAHAVLHSWPGTVISCILPDVLRSGSRYEKWRRFIGDRAQINHIENYGKFDMETEVHVFMLHLRVCKKKHSSGWNRESSVASNAQMHLTLGDKFKLSVGSVVDFRDPETGPFWPFATVLKLPKWQTITQIAGRRRYKGTVFMPPFVAIRRTSKADDKNRAIGTIVNLSKPVAVENHLIVAKPLDGTLKSCELLLRTLSDAKTSEWLNTRIRCRHLTVTALRELPLWGNV